MSSPSAHKRKFLVVIDDTPESDRAVTFAANRVHHVGGSVVLLSVLQTQDFAQFLGVEEVMRAEARDEIERLLDARLARIASIGDIRTETVIREGDMREAIERLVTEDPEIGILVLAASSGKDGPGQLITDFAARSGGAALPVIVTIIPGTMTDAQIIAAT
ncbi:universal stress protein [Devosia sp.]|uniref:universal stress protein n=1 Tax=Devosia sp. TaxID=1871048 RepID=UPI0037BE3410